MSLATMMSTIGWLGFLASLVALATANPSYDLIAADSGCSGPVTEGMKCNMNLTVTIPATETTNLKLEIFLPSNQTIVFQLCKPTVAVVGSALSSTSGVVLNTVQPTMDAQVGTFLFTRAVYDFGNVTSTSGSNNQLLISFCAVRIANASATPNTIYYVVAGRDDDVLNEIWVGRVGYNISGSPAVGSIGTPTVTSTSNIEIGGYAKVQLTVPLSGISASFIVNAYGSSNNVALLSPVSISIGQASQSGFSCLWSNKDYITKWTETPATATGKYKLSMNLGQVTKDGGSSNVVIDIVYHAMNTAALGPAQSVTIEVVNGTSYNNTVAFTYVSHIVQNLTSVPTATFTIVNPQPVYPVGSMVSVNLDLQIPFNTSYDYQLQVVNGINMSDSRVHMCGADVLAAGINFGFGAWNYVKPITESSNNNTPDVRDKLTWNVGTISNFGSFSGKINPGAETITFRIYARIANHSLNVHGQNVSLAVAIFNGDSGFWLGQFWVPVDSNFSLIENDTDIASPAFSFSFPSGNPNAYIGQAKEMLIDVTTGPGMSYSMMDSSFYTPSANGRPIVSVCSVEVVNVGRNLPCVDQTAANLAATLVYRLNGSTQADEASAPVGAVCNSGAYMPSQENHLKVRVVVRLEQHENVTANNTAYPIGAGTIYSDKRLWAADLSLYAFLGAQPGATVPPSIAVDPASVTANSNGPFSAKLVIKVPYQKMQNYTLTSALSPANGARVCSMKIVKLGRNVPCISKTLTVNGALNQSSQISQFYGVWSSAGSVPFVNNSVIDDDTVLVDVFGQAASGTFTLVNTVNGVSVNQNFNASTVNAALNLVPNVTVDMNPFPNGSVPTALLQGQSFSVKAVLTYVANSCPSVTLTFKVPNTQAVFCSAIASRAGINLPCFNRDTITYTTSTSGGFSIVTVNVGYLCHHNNADVFNALDNQLEIIAFGSVAAAATGTLPVSINATAGSSVTATVTPAIAVANAFEVDQKTDVGVDAFLDNTTDDLSAVHIGQKFKLSFRLRVPAYAIGKTLIEGISPIMNGSSVFHINSATVVGWGRHIVCKYDAYNFSMASTMSDGNNDRSFVDLGTVMHQGIPITNANTSDDEIVVTFEFVLTDHVMTFNNSEFWVTAGAVIGSSVIVIQRKVVVFRTGLEVAIPKLTVTADKVTVSGLDTIRLTAIAGHVNGSACDLLNVTVQIYISSMLTFSTNNALNGSAAGDTAGYANGMFTMEIGRLRVGSTVSVEIIFVVNATTQQVQRIVVPFQMMSTVRMVGGLYSELPTNLSSLALTYQSSCNNTQNVQPCQVTSLYNSATAGNAVTATGLQVGNERQQVTVYFGSRLTMSSFDVIGAPTGVSSVVVASSEDGYNWVNQGTLTVTTNHAAFSAPALGRYFRFGPFTFIGVSVAQTNTIKFTFYGCPATSDVAPNTCISPQMVASPAAMDRCAMVLPGGPVFACDYAGKLNTFACWRYDGANTWTRLKGISSLISYTSASDEQLLLAYHADRQHIGGSIDMGNTWFNVDNVVETARMGTNVTACTSYGLDGTYSATLTAIAGTAWQVSGVGLWDGSAYKFQWQP